MHVESSPAACAAGLIYDSAVSGGSSRAGARGFRGVRDFGAKDYLEHYTRFEPGTGCLIWTGVVANGKPTAKLNGRNTSARRFAWRTLTWAPPPGRLYAACGNPLCVHPNHTNQALYLRGVGGLRELVRLNTETDGDHLLWRAEDGDDGPEPYIRPDQNTRIRVRIVTWEERFGKLPDSRIYIARACESPQCVNPEHAVLLRGQAALKTGKPASVAERALFHNAMVLADHISDFPGQSLPRMSRFCRVPVKLLIPALVEAVLRGWVTGHPGDDQPLYYPVAERARPITATLGDNYRN